MVDKGDYFNLDYNASQFGVGQFRVEGTYNSEMLDEKADLQRYNNTVTDTIGTEFAYFRLNNKGTTTKAFKARGNIGLSYKPCFFANLEKYNIQGNLIGNTFGLWRNEATFDKMVLHDWGTSKPSISAGYFMNDFLEKWATTDSSFSMYRMDDSYIKGDIIGGLGLNFGSSNVQEGGDSKEGVCVFPSDSLGAIGIAMHKGLYADVTSNILSFSSNVAGDQVTYLGSAPCHLGMLTDFTAEAEYGTTEKVYGPVMQIAIKF
jgi:hypothetical protein